VDRHTPAPEDNAFQRIGAKVYEYEITPRDLNNITSESGEFPEGGKYYQVTIGETEYWSADKQLLRTFFEQVYLDLRDPIE
jgi:hypothetical protein